jgi:hypothetical protein
MSRRLVVACVALCGGLAVSARAQTSPAARPDGGTAAASASAAGRGATSSPATSATAAAGDAMMTSATFDPARIRMKIETLQVSPPKVGAQGTGTLVIVNTGPGYEATAKVTLPYWMLSIADAEGTKIHMAGGGWSGPMKTGEKMTFTFDTHSTTMPGAQGKAFVFPKPGKYVVTMSVLPGGGLLTPVDTKTITVEVPTPNPALK